MQSKIEILDSYTRTPLEGLYLEGLGLYFMHPLTVSSVDFDIVNCEYIAKVGKQEYTIKLRIPLETIDTIRDTDNNVLYEADTPLRNLQNRLYKHPVSVEFDFKVDSRFRHLKGKAHKFDWVDGELLLEFEMIHDGVFLSKNMLPVKKIENLKIIGGNNGTKI